MAKLCQNNLVLHENERLLRQARKKISFYTENLLCTLFLTHENKKKHKFSHLKEFRTVNSFTVQIRKVKVCVITLPGKIKIFSMN